MRALVVASLAVARTTQTTLDAATGYPKTPTDADLRGGGRHVTHRNARTMHGVSTMGHPDSRTSVAVVLDTQGEASLSAAQRLLVVDLDASWTTRA